MTRIALLVVCACSLSVYASGAASKEPDRIPPELIPPGFTAADCRITKPGGPDTEEGSDGRQRTVGKLPPKVACTKHPVTITHSASCHTEAGKELPPADCCLNADGSKIQNCEPKPHPADE
jgi:hypothetical protein